MNIQYALKIFKTISILREKLSRFANLKFPMTKTFVKRVKNAKISALKVADKLTINI